MWNALKKAFGGQPNVDPELESARRQMALDQQEVTKRFVGCLLSISYEIDPAYRGQFSLAAVNDWYGIRSREQLSQRIEGYLAGGLSTPGYDAFRAAFLARAAVPVGYLSAAESWALGQSAAQRVQLCYDGWLGYGMGYLQGHLDYRRSRGDSHEKLAGQRSNLMQRMNEQARGPWSATLFRSALCS
jgi:hypothetical protein